MFKLAAMPIYGKNLKKNHLLWNQKADDHENWNAALDTRVLEIRSYDIPRMTVTCLKPRSNLVPYAFSWENGKTMYFFFSEIVVVYYIKVDRCSQLNEYMKRYEYQRSRSLIDLDPNHTDSIFLNFFSSITADFNITSALR